MAGEISKDPTARLLLDLEIVKAHQEGLIHFHDSDYFAQHMHNCDLVNLEDMLQNGTVISGTYRKSPRQLFHRLQHCHSDHCTGGLQPVRRSSISSDSSGSLCGRLPQEDRRRGRSRDGRSRRPPSARRRRSWSAACATRSTAACRPYIRWSPDDHQRLWPPFITVFMYLGEARNAQEKADLAIIIEETIRQRYQGVEERGRCVDHPRLPQADLC